LSASFPGASVSSLLTRPGSTDEEIERAWRAGDRLAFGELFRRHYRGVVAYATRFTGDQASAEDVVQQAFMNILQRKRGSGRFKALIYTTTRNLALNERRRRGRRYVAKLGLEGPEPKANAEQPLAQLVREEEQQAFSRAVEALPEDEREAFCLKETEGMTYAEVGQVMGLHPDAVRRRVGKALVKIRESVNSERGSE
jgi:RNA polymerase sigma-70 factor, ECF subfamily